MYPLNISIFDLGKVIEQGKQGLYVTEIITYKNPFVVNGKPEIVSLALVEGVVCNTIFHGRSCKQLRHK